jgi:hypothetical protein
MKKGRPTKRSTILDDVVQEESLNSETPPEYHELTVQDIYDYFIVRDVEHCVSTDSDKVWKLIQQFFPPSDYGHNWKTARKIFDALLARNYTLHFILDQVMRYSAAQQRMRKTVDSYVYAKTIANWLRDDLPNNTYPDLTSHLGVNKWKYDDALKAANKPPTYSTCPQCEKPFLPRDGQGYCDKCEDEIWTNYAKEYQE